MSNFFKVGLQHPERLPPNVREELEQLVASLQRWSSTVIPVGNIPEGDLSISASQIVSGQVARARGGTGIDTSGATDGQLLIGDTGDPFALNTITAGTNVTVTNGPGTITIAASGGGSGTSAFADTCQGRLTTQTGVPISTSDRTAQSTLYFTPYRGTSITLYDGVSTWTMYPFTERSLALSGLTSGKNYDVFLYSNSGTLTLELSAAWTNDTTRSGALALQDGIYVKSGATTRRYLGTIRTTGTTTTEDSQAKRFVWNWIGGVERASTILEGTDTWSYGTDTIRQANGSTANQVEYVSGIAELLIHATILANIQVLTNTLKSAKVGVGVDSTTTFSGLAGLAFNNGANAQNLPMCAQYRGTPGLGYHVISWNEKGASAGTSLFVGDNGGDSSQSGLTVTLCC